MRTPRADLFVLAAILAAALIATAGTVDAFRQNQKPAPLTQQSARSFSGDAIDASLVNHIRGGASGIDVDIGSSDEEETDEEEEEEILLAPKLAKATKKAAKKAVKKSVAAAMKPKKKKSSLMKFFQIPYIVKACLNPMVLFQMTAGYWKSLYNISYMSDNVRFVSWSLFCPRSNRRLRWNCQNLVRFSIRSHTDCVFSFCPCQFRPPTLPKI